MNDDILQMLKLLGCYGLGLFIGFTLGADWAVRKIKKDLTFLAERKRANEQR
jgi:hypothetical protein